MKLLQLLNVMIVSDNETQILCYLKTVCYTEQILKTLRY